MPVDPVRLKDVFAEALGRTDPAARAAYLAAACAGDGALRSRVEALLRASEQADSLLDSHAPNAPGDATAVFPPNLPDPTRTFGVSAATDSFRPAPSAETEGAVIAGEDAADAVLKIS